MSKEMMKEIASEAAKASPPVALVGTSIAQGWTINHAVAALTIVYLALQIGWLLWRWYREATGQEVRSH